MDITKVGSALWSEPGVFAVSASAADGLLDDIANSKLTNSVGDLLNVTRSRNRRQFVAQKYSNAMSASAPLLIKTTSEKEKTSTKKRLPLSPLRQNPPGVSYSIQERPANREEIASLERQLEDRIRTVLYAQETDHRAVETGDLYQPHKEAFTIIRDRLLHEFCATSEELDSEPWLERLIQCEGLMDVCDGVSSQLNDMVSVNSSELGNVLRKLRFSYKQSFEQMRAGWKQLRGHLMDSNSGLSQAEELIRTQNEELKDKELAVRKKFDLEIAELTKHFELEKARDKERLISTEFKMEQMSETLRSLNGIFKAMQTDGSAARTADILAKNQRLEKENADLAAEALTLDKIKAELAATKERLVSLEADMRRKDTEVASFRVQLARRDEAIADLMERESLRNAEIEKMKYLTKVQEEADDEDEAFNEPATSVLCIKCKKSLDDLSNIRSAVLGTPGTDGLKKLQCEYFRILLPNLRGRKPFRTNGWIRSCMRAIMFTKLREDVQLLSIKGELSRFPQFVFAWFERHLEGLSGHKLVTATFQADEDRWGLFYGVKALAKDDPEAMIFWALLDEAYSDDGLQYICHCLSVVLSLGGAELWNQFGVHILTRGGNADSLLSIPATAETESRVRSNIWLEVGVAREATGVILARANSSSLRDSMEAIEALKVVPAIVDPELNTEDDDDEALVKPKKKEKETKPEPTHISLFMWLRVLLQQMQAEQLNRGAALRLMFETASIGALTPQLPVKADRNNVAGTTSLQVEYPQFQSICRTLFPNTPTVEIATLYTLCYEEGKRRVTADVFTKMADRRGLFSRTLRLSALPLLLNHAPLPLPSVAAPTGLGELPTRIESAIGGQDPDEVGPAVLDPDAQVLERQIRMQLGSLVHRKLAAITPDLNILMEQVPEKWRALLMESRDVVLLSLKEGFAVAKKQSKEPLDNILRHHIDGIQPYVHYRRLLSLSLMVKSLTDNPLLPGELFKVRHRNVLPSLQIGMRQVERMLSAIEEGLVLGTDSADKLNSRFFRFEKARHAIIVRRVQNVVRNFICFNNAPVPRPVRKWMRPGYLRGAHDIRPRDSVPPPWWTQEALSGIYSFKLAHDRKAAAVGLQPLPLGAAVASFFFLRWGAIDAAERSIHDLFSSLAYYKDGIPRFRIFLCMLGVSQDMDQPMEEIFRSNQSIAMYLNLLVEVHREHQITTKKAAYELEMAHNRLQQYREVKAIGIIINDEGEKTEVLASDAAAASSTGDGGEPRASEDSTAAAAEPAGPLPWLLESIDIDVLFPCSSEADSGIIRADGRDAWYAEVPILQRAVRRWCGSIRGIDKAAADQMCDLVQKLRRNRADLVEVDDALWIVMTQWVRYSAWYAARALQKASWHDRRVAATGSKSSDASSGRPPSSSSSSSSKNYQPLTSSYLSWLVESAYRPGEGSKLVSPHSHLPFYLHVLTGDKSLQSQSPPPFIPNSSEAVTENSPDSALKMMERLLRDCIYFDINTGEHENRPAGAPVAVAGNADPSMALASAHRLHTCHRIVSTCSPILSLAALNIAITAYQQPLNSMLGKVDEKLKRAPDAEIQRKSVQARRNILMVGEMLQKEEERGHGHFYKRGVSDEVKAEIVSAAHEGWAYMQQLLSSLADFSQFMGIDFPGDKPAAHPKLTVERSYVYSVLTKAVLE